MGGMPQRLASTPDVRSSALARARLALLTPYLNTSAGMQALLLRRGDVELPCAVAPTGLGCWTLLDLARGRWSGAVRAEADALPFADDSIGLVVAEHVLEALAQPGPLLAEIARVLQPGGRLLLCSYSRWHPRGWGACRRTRRTGADCHLRGIFAQLRIVRALGLERESIERQSGCVLLVLRKRRASALILHLPRGRLASFRGPMGTIPGGTHREAS